MRTTLSLCLLLAAATASAEDCGWMATSKLDAAFPQYAPWEVMVGGAAGSCKFNSDPSRPPNIFGANQMVKGSAAEAEQFVAGLRGTMEKSYVVEAAPAYGKAAFTYRPKPGSGSDERSIFFVAHRDKVAVIASLVLQDPITPAALESAGTLVDGALSIAGDPAALAAAGQCPWLDEAMLKQLLTGSGFSVQAFGSNSCMAQAAGHVVLVTIMDADDAAALAGATSQGCTTEKVAGLGEFGGLSYACTGGRPNAKVRMVAGDRYVEYSYVPGGREPTPDERALLIALAAKAQGARR